MQPPTDTVDALRARFAVPGVAIEPGPHGLTRLRVSTALADAEVYLHGGHVTHFQPRGAGPVLFLSTESRFARGQPIRGGVPVIFPWFGPHPSRPDLPAHGFARTQPWTLRDVTRGGDSVTITLSLAASDESLNLWPDPFELLYTITVGTALELSLEVHNPGEQTLRFEEALHTYLAVADVRRVGLEGLSGRPYLDKVDGMRRKTQTGTVTIEGETDRVYLDTPDTVTVHDPAGNRRLTVAKAGSGSTVVWNPWTEKSHKMSDFGDDEWPRMLCVETANVAENAMALAPGARHVMRAVVRGE